MLRKRRVFCHFLYLISCFLIIWILFIKYTYYSVGKKLMFPASWKPPESCHSNVSAFATIWGSYLQQRVEIQQPLLYTISSQSCTEKFYPDFESNIRKVINYDILQNAPCFENEIFGDDIYFVNAVTEDVPVIVTAGSSNHFYEIQALFKSIHTKLIPLYKNLKVIFYDIGLSENENSAMKKHCNCEVRLFPFKQFPPHIGLINAYAWKPLIIFDVLTQYKFVMWLDACIRFRDLEIKHNLDTIFRRTKSIGIQLQKSPRWIVSNHTKPDTFTILNEVECLFDYPELESGWLLVWKNSFTMHSIIRPWVGCALTEHCMTHPYPSFLRPCSNDLWKFLLRTRCHRFDQSVLNIILIRIFNIQRKLIEFDGTEIAEILRDNKENYFPS